MKTLVAILAALAKIAGPAVSLWEKIAAWRKTRRERKRERNRHAAEQRLREKEKDLWNG